MKTAKIFALFGLVAGLSLAATADTAKSRGWLTDFEKAKAEAVAAEQPVLAFFTGSDWCGWCMKLKAEVLEKKEFKRFADANLVLFMADFPRRKNVPEEVKTQNAELAQKYGVRGYPSLYLLDAEGKVLGQTGYREGGAESYVEHLTKMIEAAGFKVVAAATKEKPASAFEALKAQQEKGKEEAAKETRSLDGAPIMLRSPKARIDIEPDDK